MSDAELDEKFYRDTESVAFPKLDDRQLAQLDPLGQRRRGRESVGDARVAAASAQRQLPCGVVRHRHRFPPHRGKVSVHRPASVVNAWGAIPAAVDRPCRAGG